jgi:uncharacterized protein
VPRDYKQAAEWFRRAAEQGNAAARYDLSVSYQKGEGVPQNGILTYMLADLAAMSGSEPGRRTRKLLQGRLSAAQIAEAHSLPTNWIVNTSRPPKPP